MVGNLLSQNLFSENNINYEKFSVADKQMLQRLAFIYFWTGQNLDLKMWLLKRVAVSLLDLTWLTLNFLGPHLLFSPSAHCFKEYIFSNRESKSQWNKNQFHKNRINWNNFDIFVNKISFFFQLISSAISASILYENLSSFLNIHVTV